MHASETRSGGKGKKAGQRKTWLYLALKTQADMKWTGERAYIRERHSDPEILPHREHTAAGPVPGPDTKSLPGAPAPP